METARKKGGERTDRKTEKEEREETLSLGITVTEQVKRDKCQRTLGEIKQQLACTHPGEREFARLLASGLKRHAETQLRKNIPMLRRTENNL